MQDWQVLCIIYLMQHARAIRYKSYQHPRRAKMVEYTKSQQWKCWECVHAHVVRLFLRVTLPHIKIRCDLKKNVVASWPPSTLKSARRACGHCDLEHCRGTQCPLRCSLLINTLNWWLAVWEPSSTCLLCSCKVIYSLIHSHHLNVPRTFSQFDII